MADGPLIAVIGSVRAEVSGSDSNQIPGQRVAKEIGRELAKAEMKLIVYSSDSRFIESHVVAGYAEVANDAEKMIQVRYPSDMATSTVFAEENDAPNLFEKKMDDKEYWEASYYKSLAEVDGVLLIGGGRSTLAGGHIALNAGIPIAAIKGYGGESERIWKLLHAEDDYRGSIDLQAMADHQNDFAKIIVVSLKRRCDTRSNAIQSRQDLLKEQNNKIAYYESTEKRLRPALFFAAIYLIILIAALIGVLSTAWFTALLVVALITAGALGAAITELWQSSGQRRPAVVLLFGGVAGLIVGISYLVPLLLDNQPDQPFLFANTNLSAQLQFVLATVTAFLAGFAYEAFMSQARTNAEERIRSALGAKGN